ncbi:hypothetical protein NC651_011299 [Populus alba x Populus x berolinensis]|nr:hypothetical protein NC651_011299 [Populus alba x Populus x berolinensis]
MQTGFALHRNTILEENGKTPPQPRRNRIRGVKSSIVAFKDNKLERIYFPGELWIIERC